MTTPTEELAKKCGATFPTINGFEFQEHQLQAFREAVEAESDAERMKQDAVVYAVPDFVYMLKRYGRTLVEAKKSDLHTFPLYAQPFPSTEQLQQQLSATESHRKSLLGHVETYAVEMADAKLAGFDTAQDLFTSYTALQQRVRELTEAAIEYMTAQDEHFNGDMCCTKEDVARSNASDKRLYAADEALRKALANTQGDSKMSSQQEEFDSLYQTARYTKFGLDCDYIGDSTVQADVVIAMYEQLAEANKKLAEQQALVKKLHGYAPAAWLDDCSGAGFEELNSLLAKAKEEGSTEVQARIKELTELKHELLGVISDVEDGDGFDAVCLNTIKRVYKSLSTTSPTEALDKVVREAKEDMRERCASHVDHILLEGGGTYGDLMRRIEP